MPYKDKEKRREAGRVTMRRWREANPWLTGFNSQRSRAQRRGIEWLLSFEDWCAIWEASGKWKQRGKLAGQYVMARFGDQGAYVAGNVRICPTEENVIEAQLGRQCNHETRQRMALAARLREKRKREARHGTSFLK